MIESSFFCDPMTLALPTPGRLSRSSRIRSAWLESSSGVADPVTETMRMGWLFTSNFAITGLVASLGRESTMPSSAFWTSITAEFMFVDIVNCTIV